MNYFFAHLLDEFQLPLKNPVLVFSLLLFIILLTPIVLRRIRIPAIIGLIISGILIGPHGLGLIGIEHLKAEGSIKLFSTIGLLYIMFMAGLELDMNEFKKYMRKSLVFGALTFSIPLFLGLPVCFYLLNLSPTASWLTASMFATHTLVAYPIISKYGLTKNNAVAVTIGGTILTDTAVLIILAIISSSAKGDLDIAFWLRLVTSLSIFSIIMFVLIPKIARWFFSKLDSEKTSQYIFVLSIVFFAAFLAEVAGVEHIIGAFVAGLVLNRLIPHSSPLMNRVEFIGNSLFIPFFLIFVGTVVNYQVLFNGTWALVIAGILTAFAIFSKWLAALFTQLIFKMTNTERQLIFGLSTSHAAATLAIIMVGYDNHILDVNIVNGTVLLILITCMTASFVTESAGKKMLMEQSDLQDIEKSDKSLKNQHTLLAINEISGNEILMDFSVLITDKNGINPISVVSVTPNDKEAERMVKTSRKAMEEIVRHYSGADTKVNAIATIDYNLSSGIARVSKELFVDLVVLNDSKKMNLLMRIVGDDRDHLLDVCDRTVFFCQLDRPAVSYNKVVVICPPLSELELSFALWVERIVRFSKQCNLRLELYAAQSTIEKWIKIVDIIRLTLDQHFIEIEDLDDFFIHSSGRHVDDLIVFCSSRKGSVSHSSGVDGFPGKLDKAYNENDSIYIYPSQNMVDKTYSNYEDIDSSAISYGVEAIQKISKEVGSIFKKS